MSKIYALIQEKKLLYEAEVESYWKKRSEKGKGALLEEDIWRQKVKANQKLQSESCMKSNLSGNLEKVLVDPKGVGNFQENSKENISSKILVAELHVPLEKAESVVEVQTHGDTILHQKVEQKPMILSEKIAEDM